MGGWGKVIRRYPAFRGAMVSGGCPRVKQTSSSACVGERTLGTAHPTEAKRSPGHVPVLLVRGGKSQIPPALSSSSATYHIFNFAWAPIGSERTI